MALLKVICWALIFIIRIRFPPGKSLATILDLITKKISKCGAIISRIQHFSNSDSLKLIYYASVYFLKGLMVLVTSGNHTHSNWEQLRKIHQL